MTTQHTLPIITVQLHWQEEWNGPVAPHLLRGALANAFKDNDLFHQHDATGNTIRRYPRIQYRWDTRNQSGLIFGFGQGLQTLATLCYQHQQLQIGNQLMTIAEARLSCREHTVEILPRLKRYTFRSPWLPLNQNNYKKYKQLTEPEKQQERDRIAVGNILSACKGLDIRFSDQIYAAFEMRKEVTCTYKSEKLLGFFGTLLTNVSLPHDLAIGKAVSHGYGWLQEATPATTNSNT